MQSRPATPVTGSETVHRQHRRRSRPLRLVLFVALVVLASALGLAVVDASGRSAAGRGPRGARGRVGPSGMIGPAGHAGQPAIVTQALTINWQNDRHAGHDSASFSAPRIGSGRVVCSRDAQQVQFRPFDQRADTVMWTTRTEFYPAYGKVVTDVRAARREANTGPQFNEGLNLATGAQTGNGSFVGLITSRLDRTLPGGPGPAPTGFRLSWYWNFSDGDPRCYVAGSFFTAGT